MTRPLRSQRLTKSRIPKPSMRAYTDGGIGDEELEDLAVEVRFRTSISRGRTRSS